MGPTRNVMRRYTQEKSPLPAGCVTRNSEMSCEDTHRRKACRMCDETFVSRTDQKCYEKMCTGQKPLACGMCNEAFVNWTYHKCHVKIHAGEKPFACMMCDMTYWNITRRYTQEKKSVCFTNLCSPPNVARKLHSCSNMLKQNPQMQCLSTTWAETLDIWH